MFLYLHISTNYAKTKVILALFHLITVSLLQSSSSSSIHQHHRLKRNVGQLVALMVADTPYTFYKMTGYGNWCGRGGDRMNDGSYIDGCDLCCKNHDKCYFSARHAFSECNPLFTLYSYQHGEQNSKDKSEKRKLPACLSSENKAPSCNEAVCQCDISFAICLKKEPCDPKSVSNKSPLWWLPG